MWFSLQGKSDDETAPLLGNENNNAMVRSYICSTAVWVLVYMKICYEDSGLKCS